MSTSVETTLKRKKESASDRPLKLFGEGDSYQQLSVFSSKECREILKELDEQIVYLPRERFKFRIFNTVNLLPRDKAFYGDVQADGSYNNDHIGYHFDKTRDFVDGSSVITLTFGGERILRLKHTKNKTTEDVPQKAGSLFHLGWKTNSIWKHSIVKTKRLCERRVSLTYRSIRTIQHKDGTCTEIDASNIRTIKTLDDNETKKIKVDNESE